MTWYSSGSRKRRSDRRVQNLQELRRYVCDMCQSSKTSGWNGAWALARILRKFHLIPSIAMGGDLPVN